MNAFNVEVFHWIAGLYAAAPWMLPVARGMAVGSAWLVAGLVLWSLWRFPAERRYLVLAIVACAATTLLAHYVAARLAVPRPFVAGFTPSFISHSPTGSMPSSHAAVMMLIAALYLCRAPLRGLGVAMLVLALATGVGRVFVGVHFPLDIGAGFLLGLAVAGVAGLVHGWLDGGRALSRERPEISEIAVALQPSGEVR